MLVNDDARVLVGQRIDMPSDAWQMPQGGVDEGESPDDAVWREVREEIGTDAAELMARAGKWLAYDLPGDMAPRVWGGRFAGQIQLWYLLRFTGTEQQIDLAAHDAEFSAVKWIPASELPVIAAWFKRDVYKQLLDEFRTPLSALAGSRREPPPGAG